MSQMIYLRDDGVVMIEAVAIEDPVVYSVMSTIETDEERAERLADMAEIGARVIQRQQEGEAGDLIRRELERMQQGLTHATEILLSGAGRGFADAMQPVLNQLSTQIAGISGKLDGALAVSEAQVEVERERERGTAKGRTFEEEVAAAVQSVANHNGDSCEHVGDVATSLSGRAGDVLVEVGGADGPSIGRIVFEAKTGRLTRPEAMRELDRARQVRDADYAVLVVPRPDKMPANVREFHEYGGDKMVVVMDSDPLMPAVGLEVGYALARARVLMIRSHGTPVGVDVNAAFAALEQAEQNLERARSIKSKMTSISNAVNATSEEVDRLVGSVRTCLQRAQAALRQSE